MRALSAKSVMALMLAALSFAGTALPVIPVDPELGKKIQEALRSSSQEGQYAATLREGRRLLELYPNNPRIQAPVYAVMSEAAQKSGDASQAAELLATARQLDPELDKQLAGASSGIKRGQGGWETAFTVIAQSAQAVQAIQQQARQQKLARMQYTSQVEQMQQQMMQLQQMRQQLIAQQQQMAQMAQQQQMPQQMAYPPAPVNDPMYQPNPVNGPMPGWGAPPPAAMPPAAAQYPAQPQPGYQQPQYAPAPQYATPYAAPTYAPPPGAMRGGKAPAIKVIHDHYLAGDNEYFAHSCGALLSVAGGNLTFTAAGGEAPVVIPAGEIREIRMNTAVGRDAGAFHIATKKGLYLHLAPAAATRESGQAAIEEIAGQLGIRR